MRKTAGLVALILAVSVAAYGQDSFSLVIVNTRHEPLGGATVKELPDGKTVLAACVDMNQTYRRSGFGPAMAKFIALVSYSGPLPSDYAEEPAPDPAMFGLPTEDDGSRDDPLLGLNMPWCAAYQHDFDALRAAPTRIVIGVGAQSGATLPARAATALAGKLGIEPVTFPGGHNGFLSGGHVGAGDPDAFAVILREALAG